jgi:G3E family GTPase
MALHFAGKIMSQQPIHNVPTNIITGFLGVGKTSAILHLLTQKPAHERWAILVNEFGEIGIDKSLFEGQLTADSGVFIREVPGGCMCCAASLPMQIALNQLLAASRPHRLLIEPTGLGHPKEVLQVLTAEHYQPVLSIQNTLTLVDARKLSDERYTQHDTFNQQLGIADVIVANKCDLYSDQDKVRLQQYVAAHCQPNTTIVQTQFGQLSLDTLKGRATNYAQPHQRQHDHSHAHDHNHEHADNDSSNTLAADQDLPANGILSANNKGEGFVSTGWRFSPDIVFDHSALKTCLSALRAERLKGVFITNNGVFGYNLTDDGLTEMQLDDCEESRVEVIATDIPGSLEAQLTACFLDSK